VTASRRVGNAVVRNRAKRLVREAFRALRSTWPTGFDLVVIVRGPPGQRRLDQVVAEWQSARERLRRCWQRLGLEAAPDAGTGACARALTDEDSC
jgi:ribonuclease P protein component